MIIVRFADDFIVGFEYPSRMRGGSWSELRERFAKFGLELHPGQDPADRVRSPCRLEASKRGVGKPETFDFLGLTHICAKGKRGRFWVRRITIAKRMRAKLREIKIELKRRRHRPVPEQGAWLRSVVQGHLVYYAVPGNTDTVAAFRTQVTRHWYMALRRRSQQTRLTWGRMNRLANRWLPPARVRHPFPAERFAART